MTTLESLQERAHRLAGMRAEAWKSFQETKGISALREYNQSMLALYEKYDARHCEVIDAIIVSKR